MYHQLYQYLDKNSLLSNFQSGFRKSFSTETVVTFFIDNIRRNMDIGLLTGAIYIEAEKKLYQRPSKEGLWYHRP